MLQVRDGIPYALQEEEPLYIPPWVVEDIDIGDGDDPGWDDDESAEESNGGGDTEGTNTVDEGSAVHI